MPMHGRTSDVRHAGDGIFARLAQSAASSAATIRWWWTETTLPDELEVTAETDDGVIMALAHRQWPIFGVQFHPESILTEGGYTLLGNFLRLAGIEQPHSFPAMASERPVAKVNTPLPTGPVTF